MPYDSERHRRRSVRLKDFDYAGNATYFVTICTVGRDHLFGEIIDGGMRTSPEGDIAGEEWDRSIEIRSELIIHAFVVMPNHVHGLITLHPRRYAHRPSAEGKTAGRSLGSFVTGFKSATTRRVNALRGLEGVPVWQRNYHEHIVRSEASFNIILNYVHANPARWVEDRENVSR